MARDEQFTRGTVNEALSRGQDRAQANLLSAGYTPHGHPDPRSPLSYNGGLESKRVSRLQQGDLIFRFSASDRLDRASKFSGCWWFDRECLVTIRWAARLNNMTFADAARSHLGVLYEWGDMKNLVGGILTADFWCYKGLTAAIVGERQKLSGPMRTDVVQIYVPGGLTLGNFRQPHDDVLTSGIV